MLRKITILFILTISAFLVSYSIVSAQKGVPINPEFYPKGAPTISGTTAESITNINEARFKLTMRIVNVILGIAGVIAIFFILNNGWFLIISAGGEEKVTQYKKGLTWAIVGLIFIILSYSIIRFVISITFQADEALNAPVSSSAAETTTPPSSP